MAEPLGIGVIGAGAIAVLRHLPAFAAAGATGAVSLAAIYDVDQARAREVAAQFGIPVVSASLDDLVALPAVQAVSICSPNVAHYAQSMAALAAGKHVQCEKPIAMTLAEARSMVAAARQAGVVTGVNFRYRWIPAAQFVTDLVRSGALGHIYHGIFTYVNGSMADPTVPVAWRSLRAQAGSGVLGDLGSHMIDLAASWFGEADRVRGSLVTFTPERPTRDGGSIAVDTDDAASFTVDYASGAVGHFLVSRCAAGRGNFQRVELYGSQGGVTYEFDRWDRGSHMVSVCLGANQARVGGYASIEVSPTHLLGTPDGALNEWLAAMQEGRPAVPSFEEGLRCQEIIAAVEESVASDRTVPLPLP
jgi:predicted dehydrogenase